MRHFPMRRLLWLSIPVAVVCVAIVVMWPRMPVDSTSEREQRMILQFAIKSPSFPVDSHHIGGYVTFVNDTSHDVTIPYCFLPKETLHIVVMDESGTEILNQSMVYAFAPRYPNIQNNLVVPGSKAEDLGFVWLGQLDQPQQKPGKYKLRVEANWPGLPKLVSNEAEFELR